MTLYIACYVHRWQVGERRRRLRAYVFRYSLESSQRSWIFNKILSVSARFSKGQQAELKPWITFLLSQAIKLCNGEKDELPRIGCKSKKWKQLRPFHFLLPTAHTNEQELGPTLHSQAWKAGDPAGSLTTRHISVAQHRCPPGRSSFRQQPTSCSWHAICSGPLVSPCQWYAFLSTPLCLLLHGKS